MELHRMTLTFESGKSVSVVLGPARLDEARGLLGDVLRGAGGVRSRAKALILVDEAPGYVDHEYVVRLDQVVCVHVAPYQPVAAPPPPQLVSGERVVPRHPSQLDDYEAQVRREADERRSWTGPVR